MLQKQMGCNTSEYIGAHAYVLQKDFLGGQVYEKKDEKTS
jgi:hypothetical protein